jgi:hypothetical protein
MKALILNGAGAVREADVVALATPLYVDSLPGPVTPGRAALRGMTGATRDG